MVQMAMGYEGQSESYEKALEIVNLVFTCIFIGEALLKITALGFSNYFKDN